MSDQAKRDFEQAMIGCQAFSFAPRLMRPPPPHTPEFDAEWRAWADEQMSAETPIAIAMGIGMFALIAVTAWMAFGIANMTAGAQ